jgi:hypothetical protein
MDIDDSDFIAPDALLTLAPHPAVDLGLQLEANAARIENNLRRIIRLVGWRHWERKYRFIEFELDRFSFSRRNLSERHYLEVAIPQMYKRLMLTGRIDILRDPRFVGVATFVKSFGAIYDNLDPEGRRKLLGAVRSGLDSRRSLRALEWEFFVSGALASRGYELAPIDLRGAGRFDWLARHGDLYVEVECKHIVKVKGSWKPEGYFRPLYVALEDEYLHTFSPSDQMWQVSLEYLDELRMDRATVLSIAEALRTTLRTGLPLETTGVRLEPTPIGEFNGDLNQLFANAEKVAEDLQSDELIIFGGCATPFILSIKDVSTTIEEKRSRLAKIWRRFLRAASGQLAHAHPGILMIQIERGLRMAGSRQRKEKAAMERASVAALVDEQLDAIGKDRPTLAGVSLSFGGPPFSGGGTLAVKNRHAKAVTELLDQLSESRDVPSFIVNWFDEWDSKWFAE